MESHSIASSRLRERGLCVPQPSVSAGFGYTQTRSCGAVGLAPESACLGSIGDIGNIRNIGLLRPKENASEVPLRNLAGLTGYNKKADSEFLPNLPLVEYSAPKIMVS